MVRSQVDDDTCLLPRDSSPIIVLSPDLVCDPTAAAGHLVGPFTHVPKQCVGGSVIPVTPSLKYISCTGACQINGILPGTGCSSVATIHSPGRSEQYFLQVNF